MKQKARAWQVRLTEEMKHNKNGHFVTLTFSPEALQDITEKIRIKDPKCTGYELDNAIAKYAVRHWLELIRKHTKKSVRHWLVTELGQKATEHLHLHGIVWTNDIKLVLDKWKYGFTDAGEYCDQSTVSYITKYITKLDSKHKTYNSIILTSAGIGSNYLKNKYGNWTKNVYHGETTNETYRTPTGHKIALPIYYRNKIYTDEEREKPGS